MHFFILLLHIFFLYNIFKIISNLQCNGCLSKELRRTNHDCFHFNLQPSGLFDWLVKLKHLLPMGTPPHPRTVVNVYRSSWCWVFCLYQAKRLFSESWRRSVIIVPSVVFYISLLMDMIVGAVWLLSLGALLRCVGFVLSCFVVAFLHFHGGQQRPMYFTEKKNRLKMILTNAAVSICGF